MKLNQLYNENCLATMLKMENDFIDLTVTSPPYDDLRQYNGYHFPFEDIAKELFRVTKKGGVVVWVVNDGTVKGSETGTSFKQALYFKECGFNIHDTMIYEKSGMAYPDSNRYHQVFEYMFILSKGAPKTVNLIKDRENKFVGTMGGNKRGGLCKREKYGARFNVWRYANGRDNSSKDRIAFQHPAIFPESLAHDHIISWSNEGDLVYDPFMGSGTTGKMAVKTNRNWIGSEISSDYCKIARQRIKDFSLKLTIFEEG
jgi:DNA modification methylase